MTDMGYGRNGRLNISKASPRYDPNIMGKHRNSLFTDEGGNKDSKPDIDTAKWSKFLFNYPLKTKLPDYNFARNEYVIPIILQKYIKGIKPGGISWKEGNKLEEYQLQYVQKEHYI